MSDPPRDHRPRTVRLALFLMAIGLTIYGAFRVVQSDLLVMAGLAWVPIGCLFVLAGLLLLRNSPKPVWRASLLLLANFPVALLCMVSAVDVMTRVEVYVENDSGETLTDLRLVLRSFDASEVVVELPDLPPGRRTARALRPEDDGELWLEFRTAAGGHRTCISDYVSDSGAGAYLDVSVRPGASTSVNRSRPTFLWPVLP